MVEIRTAQTERLVALHPETPPLASCVPHSSHTRVTEDPENDDVIRLLSRAGGRLSPANGFLLRTRCHDLEAASWNTPSVRIRPVVNGSASGDGIRATIR